MRKRKLIFITGVLLTAGIFVLWQSSLENNSFQEEAGNTVYEEFADEKNDNGEISDNDIGKLMEEMDDKYIQEKSFSDSDSENVATKEEEDHKLYMYFLSGEITTTDGISIDDIIIPTGEPESRYFTEYTFFDSDQDSFQELHVRSARYYYIIDCEKRELSTWMCLLPHTELLNNGDFLYWHAGGAPTHYNYQYIKVDKEGEIIWTISFSCYDDNVDGQFDEKDKYYDERRKEISYEQWVELKKRYLDVGKDEIFWTTLTEEIY